MQYQKIQTVFKRDPDTKYRTLLDGQFSLPEFEYLANNDWVFTEKVDGSNTVCIWDGVKVSYQGKTEDTQIPGDRKSTRLNSSHTDISRMPSSA